jgi:predicted HD phosphohydrolase
MQEDFFRKPGKLQSAMRTLLEREAGVRAPRFGLERRHFLGGALGALAALRIAEQTPRFRSLAEAQDGFVPPSEDCYAALDEQHGLGTAKGGALDWDEIEAASRVQQTATADTVLNMLRSVDGLYMGFGVSQLVHNTQTATRAVRANVTDELVLISLLHDVGETIANLNHAEIAGALLRPFVSEGAYRAVRHHMEFQLKHYGAAVGLPTDMRERYANEPWYQQAAVLSDSFDQTSFDPDYPTLPLEEFEPLVRDLLSAAPRRELKLGTNCP